MNRFYSIILLDSYNLPNTKKSKGISYITNEYLKFNISLSASTIWLHPLFKDSKYIFIAGFPLRL